MDSFNIYFGSRIELGDDMVVSEEEIINDPQFSGVSSQTHNFPKWQTGECADVSEKAS